MSESLKRPAIQRTEIGPLFSTIVPEVLERASQYPLDDELGETLQTTDLEYALHVLAVDIKSSTIWGIEQWVETHLTDSRVSAIPDLYKAAEGKRNLYYGTAEEILTEGMMSGVVVPLKLYHVIECFKRQQSGVEAGQRTGLLKSNLPEILHENWFEAMLHQLALPPNGELGEWSTSVEFSLEESLPWTLSKSVQSQGDGFVLDETYFERVKALHTRARKLDRESSAHSVTQDSGGCPVRHATFKKIGPIALDAFANVRILPHTLQDPDRKSAISLCRDFVAERAKQALDLISDQAA